MSSLQEHKALSRRTVDQSKPLDNSVRGPHSIPNLAKVKSEAANVPNRQLSVWLVPFEGPTVPLKRGGGNTKSPT